MNCLWPTQHAGLYGGREKGYWGTEATVPGDHKSRCKDATGNL